VCFPTKASHIGVASEKLGADHLQRHRAIERYLPCTVDDAHATASDLLQELVVAKTLRETAPVGCGRTIAGAVSVRFGGGEASREATARAEWAINGVDNGSTVEAVALGPRPGG
jgi:hypothetical protein